MIETKIKKLFPDIKLPNYGYPGDAGLDLYSREDKELKPGEKYTFFVGFALEFPAGNTAIVKDKSSLAQKNGLHVLGGVFDAGYRGEYNVNLINLGSESYKIKQGDKIAQLIIMPFIQSEFKEVDELSDSARAEGRFGSSGR